MKDFNLTDRRNPLPLGDEQFTVCPRCQGEWEHCGIEYNKCVDCKSKYSFRSLTFYIQDFLLWNDVLYFFEDKCVYQTFDDFLGGIELHLPLLPYDITPEKLKFYLLFS